MSFSAEQIPAEELRLRHKKCRELLQKVMPKAQGLLVFSRTNIYYLSGSRANGMLWLPMEGEPVLLVRKGENRCRLESTLNHMATFKSYSNIPEICIGFGAPLGACIAAEMQALPWSLAQMLKDRLKGIEFVAGDNILNEARFIKTAYELEILKEADALHAQALSGALNMHSAVLENDKVILEQSPKNIAVGMTEREISHVLWRNFFALGHGGMLRVHGVLQETFLGKIAIAENALYPSPFSGGMGLVGEHPSMPFMGYAGSVWKKEQVLSMDTGFVHKGYHSASFVTCFSGSNLPQIVRQAYDCCYEILVNIKENIKNAQALSSAWSESRTIVKKYGFDEEFLGITGNKAHALAQSIGLNLDEGVVISMDEGNFKPVTHTVFSVNPMIALPSFGMVGIRHSFEIDENENILAFDGLDVKKDIICIDC